MLGLNLALNLGDLVAKHGSAFKVEIGGSELHLGSEFFQEAGDFFAWDTLKVKAGGLLLLRDEGAETGRDFLLD